MTEHSIARAIPNPSIVLPTGKAALPMKAGQANAFKAKAGEHYGNFKKKDAEEQLLDNVVAKPTGEDAKPVDAEGTGLTLESAFIQASVRYAVLPACLGYLCTSLHLAQDRHDLGLAKL